ncbi:MAG: 6-bladed beta-propeller [Bacteroidales bacterium]|nr:6-bladed beta-propeller [Bacteroidales bacterium]
MNNFYTPIILIIIFSISCTNQKKRSNDESIDLVVHTDVSNEIKMSDYVSGIKYLPLGNNYDNVVGKIDKVVFYGTKIIILDSKTNKIVVYDNTGKYNFETLNIGRGPGEYLNIADFIIDSVNGNIELWDNGNRKLMVLASNGRFLSEWPMDLHMKKFGKLDSDLYIYYTCNYPNDGYAGKGSYNIYIADSSNNVLKCFLPISGLKHLKLVDNNLFSKSESGFNVTVPFDNHIYQITSEKCIQKFNIRFSNYSLPDELLEVYAESIKGTREEISNASIMLMNKINNSNYALGIHNIFENGKILFFQYQVTGIGTFTAIYNKKTNELDVGTPVNDIDFGLFGKPVAIDRSNFFTYIYPYDLIKQKELLEKSNSFDSRNPEVQRLRHFIDSIQPSDNPIIIRYSLK